MQWKPLNCSMRAAGSRRRISAAFRGTFAVPPVQHTTPMSSGATPAARTVSSRQRRIASASRRLASSKPGAGFAARRTGVRIRDVAGPLVRMARLVALSGTDDQLRGCRRFAEDHGYVVAAEQTDAARSGATLDREGMRKLLAAAGARPAPFEAVLVDDLSRLSRDLGNTWRIVFEDLAAAGVRVVDCTTGRSSNERGARLTFGVTALMNDAFLESVRAETHRGLEGRARARGFHTGGRCYGYTTTPETKPADPEHPRATLRVQPDEAKRVREILRTRSSGIRRGSSGLRQWRMIRLAPWWGDQDPICS
jgi:DNA invertase Pin-like site-specific DNA recombinase